MIFWYFFQFLFCSSFQYFYLTTYLIFITRFLTFLFFQLHMIVISVPHFSSLPKKLKIYNSLEKLKRSILSNNFIHEMFAVIYFSSVGNQHLPNFYMFHGFDAVLMVQQGLWTHILYFFSPIFIALTFNALCLLIFLLFPFFALCCFAWCSFSTYLLFFFYFSKEISFQ